MLALATPLHAQLIALPPPAGLSGETIVSAPPGGAVVIYRVGLLGLIHKARLVDVNLTISSLAPLNAGLQTSDFDQLRLVESKDAVFGDADDVLLNTLPAAAIDVSGGLTTIDDNGNAKELGLFPLPVGPFFRFYFVVADMSATAGDGHAFRLGASFGHISTSLPSAIGLPIAASNDDRVVINGLLPDIDVSPALLSFGDVALDSTSTLILTISNDGAAELNVTDVASDDGQFAPDPTSFTVVPGGDLDVSVDFTPTSGGPQAAVLSIHHNVTGSPTTVDLSGVGIVPGPQLEVTPSSVDFGNIAYGTVGEGSVSLTNVSSATIDVTQIASSDPQFECAVTSLTLAPNEVQPIALTFPPSSLGTKTADLTITHSAGAPLSLPLTADATVVLEDSEISFGNVAVGSAAVLPVRVENPSAADVTITSIVSDNPLFVPVCSPCLVPAGGSVDISVTFTPTDSRLAIARLSLTHNPTMTILLVGNDTVPYSAGSNHSYKPALVVPFGGEGLLSLMICLYAVLRRRR